MMFGDEGPHARRQALGSVPGQNQINQSQAFGNLASAYGGLLSAKAGQRQQQFQANSFNQTQPSTFDMAMKGIGSLLQPFKSDG